MENILKDYLNDIIIGIFIHSRPNKYKLKRIKEISKFIDLSEHFNLMIKYFDGDIFVFEKIYRFYKKNNNYLEKSYNNICQSVLYVNHIYIHIFACKELNEIKTIFDKYYSLLNTSYEKI